MINSSLKRIAIIVINIIVKGTFGHFNLIIQYKLHVEVISLGSKVWERK